MSTITSSLFAPFQNSDQRQSTKPVEIPLSKTSSLINPYRGEIINIEFNNLTSGPTVSKNYSQSAPQIGFNLSESYSLTSFIPEEGNSLLSQLNKVDNVAVKTLSPKANVQSEKYNLPETYESDVFDDQTTVVLDDWML